MLAGCSRNLKEGLPTSIEAKVIAVKDGDTIEILNDGKPLRIRFAHIDCPEIKNGQPFDKEAKQFTSGLCFGNTVQVINEGVFDQYGRLIGVLLNNHINVNRELLKARLAWHFVRYSTDSSHASLKTIARNDKVGLWKEEDPTAPWE